MRLRWRVTVRPVFAARATTAGTSSARRDAAAARRIRSLPRTPPAPHEDTRHHADGQTQEAEKILGLEVGADDYVTKPFSPAELRARIKAVLRRFDDDAPAGVFRFGDCEVDFDRAEVRRGGKPIDVTALELRLLGTLTRSRGRVLTREQLIRLAWGEDTYIGDRVVDTHILNLRKKIEPTPADPQFLKSVRGIGYRFDA